MPILHVRNVPARLYAELGSEAKAHGRSLSAEVIVRLEQSIHLDSRRVSMRRTLESLRRLRESMPPLPPGVNSTDWIREAREEEDERR